MSLTDKLANLHILLRARSFQRWPLRVKFFAPDMFKAWQKVAGTFLEPLRHDLRVEVEQPSVHVEGTSDLGGSDERQNAPSNTGINALDVTYQPLKAVLEKSISAVSSNNHACAVCRQSIESSQQMALVCPKDNCAAVSHLSCLSGHFLGKPTEQDQPILPTTGSCPSCMTQLSWLDLVSDLSLRIRGEKERVVIFKERRRKKGDVAEPAITVEVDETANDDAEAEDQDDLDDSGFRILEDLDDVENVSQQSGAWKTIDAQVDVNVPTVQARSKPTVQEKRRSRRESAGPVPKDVVEDSDWDSAEVIV